MKQNTKKKIYSLIFLSFFLFLSVKLFPQERRVEVVKKERRIALVIGNGSYNISPLRNPVNDANDVASILKERGFAVTLRTNASKRIMISSIREFGTNLRKGGVGLFYFAGHGMQVEGMNYLIPIGANIQAEHEILLESVNVNRILGYMKNAHNRLNILILDACRDNPFARSFRSSSQGLAQLDSPIGTLIAYSTSPGKTATDGTSRNGTYTKHLVNQIKTSNLEVGQMLRSVRSKVRKETNGKQIPWETTSLEGSFYFSTGGGPQQVKQATSLEFSKPQIKTDVQPIIPFYGLYNPGNGDHFYTTSLSESDTAVAGGYRFEGTACHIYSNSGSGRVALHRLYKPGNGDHFYTTSRSESDAAVAGGYRLEGVVGYVFSSDASRRQALYRLYNPGNGDHFYTINTRERDSAIAVGYISEGIACYVPVVDAPFRIPLF